MRFLQLIALAGVGSLAIHAWHGHGHPAATFGSAGAEASANGFVATAMPERSSADTVLILAPVHCPSKTAQRADALNGTEKSNPTADEVAAEYERTLAKN
ncbi:MAG: hypothetical protein JO133_03175 [Burkholderiaceae bacterium]|nr:hypothetical protein [Burkholderiaceae bacterium]